MYGWSWLLYPNTPYLLVILSVEFGCGLLLKLETVLHIICAFKALQESKAIWNRTGAISWLLNHQGPDGAFFDIPTTAEVIIALANTGINSLKDDNCDDKTSSSTSF